MLLAISLLVAGANVGAEETALDRYVAAPDEHYSWEQVGSDKDWFYDTYFLRLVSQQWRDESEVDRTLWEHELIVTIPEFTRSHAKNTVVLLVDGGTNNQSPYRKGEDTVGTIANALGGVVAILRQVPNQPLYFADEQDNPRTEDEILAYSMDKFLETGDENWPVQLAMTKATVRAMDALQEYLSTRRGFRIDDFIVLGASKRGWTAWLTAAADERVKAVMPISIDLMNLKEQFIHQLESYGYLAPAVQDYTAYDIGCRLRSKRGMELMRMIDPYYYRDRYTMPKLMINSAGDQFFVSDSADLYYDDLPEPKLLRNTFNTDHRQGDDDDMIDTLIAGLLWVDDVNRGRTDPVFDYETDETGALRLTIAEGKHPNNILLWQAHNPNARDFRLESIGEAWSNSRLTRESDGVYTGQIEVPETGYVAYAVELRYDEDDFGGLLDLSQYYTTKVKILPEGLPYAGTACKRDGKGNLENPGEWSHQSGIGLISGWYCDEGMETGGVEIELDGERYLPAASGTPRGDTQEACGGINNGFGLLYNFNLLGEGEHEVKLLVDGREFDASTIEVTSFGEPFVRGLEGRYLVEDFPYAGDSLTLTWDESQQNFAIGPGEYLPSESPWGELPEQRPVGNLENPAHGSNQSGIGLISGWVCDAEKVEVEIDGERWLQAAYGTPRGDTLGACGDKDNGFGLLYNMNLLGQGEHWMRLLADGVEVARSAFYVTTLGDDFLRGLSAELELPGFPDPDSQTGLIWDQSRQNFMIRGTSPLP
jgi:PhoPQ-activated pathogenicity-related protein